MIHFNDITSKKSPTSISGSNSVKRENRTLDLFGNYIYLELNKTNILKQKILTSCLRLSTSKAKNLIVEMISKMAKELKIVENSYDLENVRLGKTGIGRNYVIILMKATALYNGKN